MSEPHAVTPDVTQLKAITHPLRLRMLGLLRLHGPSTATRLAEELDLNSGVTSYHLRQLERHGFAEEATELGDRRDRWWRATAQFTRYDAPATTREGKEAVDAFHQAVITADTMRLQEAVQARSGLPEEWRRVASTCDAVVHVTPEQAGEIRCRLEAQLWQLLEGLPAPPEPAPEGTRLFEIQLHAFPRPEQPANG